MDKILQELLEWPDPLVAYSARIRILDENPDTAEMLALADKTRECTIVNGLLSIRDSTGRIPLDAYKKWNGSHWVLFVLAELGYPAGDERLEPLAGQDVEWINSDRRMRWVERRTRMAGGIPVRACASMEGAVILSLLQFGYFPEACAELVERLIGWQWPDGGWNCDSNPNAHNSSFMETLLPVRALNRYACMTGDPEALRATKQAVEVFLKRHLFKKLRDGSLMDASFNQLHYPSYWHYDILAGLKAMAECGYITDPRCDEALDWLQSRRFSTGGFPADSKFYHHNIKASGYSSVRWGQSGGKKMNPYVTVDALYVLKKAGRYQP